MKREQVRTKEKGRRGDVDLQCNAAATQVVSGGEGHAVCALQKPPAKCQKCGWDWTEVVSNMVQEGVADRHFTSTRGLGAREEEWLWRRQRRDGAPTWHSVGDNGVCAVTAATRSGSRATNISFSFCCLTGDIARFLLRRVLYYIQ